MRVGSRGQLQEWREDYDEWEAGHRHVSHLFAVYPDAQITPRTTPGLAAAARRSLELRISDASDRSIGGWSVAWLALLWARFGEGALAHEQLGNVLRKSTDISLLDLSPPGGTNPLTVFQIDGNLGAVAAVCEMLVQSHDGIDLLPRCRPSGHGERVGPAASWRVRDRPRMAGRLARTRRAPVAGRVPVCPQAPVPLAISRAGDRVATTSAMA